MLANFNLFSENLFKILHDYERTARRGIDIKKLDSNFPQIQLLLTFKLFTKLSISDDWYSDIALNDIKNNNLSSASIGSFR